MMGRSGRRRSRRFDVLDVEGSFVIRVDVRVINLSVAGMAIETHNTLIVGRRYEFRVVQGEQQIEVGGRVMWCALDSNQRRGEEVEPVFRAGIQFEEVHDAHTLALQKLIESSAAFDPGSPLLGRFAAVLGGAVGIAEQAWFEVRKLSLSGMLVDTEWAPRRNEVVPFEAHLGDSVFSGRGRVAYIERYESDDGSTRFRLGVEFTLMSDRCRDLLDHYIATLIAQSCRVDTA
jgi:hypothetical protein